MAFDISTMGETLLDMIPDMILVKGPESHILWANAAFQKYYGMNNEQLAGMIDAKVSKPDFTQQYIRDDNMVFTTGNTLDIPEEPVTRYDGEVRYFNTIKSAIKNHEGKVIMTIGISRDITDRKIAEELEEKALSEVKNMNKLMIDRELRMVELKKQIKNSGSKSP